MSDLDYKTVPVTDKKLDLEDGDQPLHELTHDSSDTRSQKSKPEESVPVLPDAVEQEQGVSRIEALYTIFGHGWKLWALYIALGLMCYSGSLESNTTYNYSIFAVSSFAAHPLLGTIAILNSILGGVSKPFIAKIADLFSRPVALSGSVVVFVAGLICTAASHNVQTYAAGTVLTTMGTTGVNIVFTILLGDLSPLKWRGFTQGLSSMPYVINGFVSPLIADSINANTGENWRWGYGMFCIILPVTIAPVLFILFWADRKAAKVGTISIAASDMQAKQLAQGLDAKARLWSWLKYYFRRIDAFGLILLGFAFSLILLPFSLYAQAENQWKNPSLIAMFICGGIIMIMFFVWEWKFTTYPLMPKHVMNRTMICCIIIDFFYYLSGYIANYFTSWIYVVKDDWSYRDYSFFIQTMSVGLCFFGLCAGVVMRYTHRYYYVLFFGMCVRCIGMGLTFLAANGNQSDAVLVMSQIIIGIGGACSVVGTQTAVQAAVPHRDMGTAIALLALWTSVGGGIGNAIAAAVWNDQLPKQLNKFGGDVFNSTQIADMVGSVAVAKIAEPREPVRLAYDATSWYLQLIALVLTCVPVVVALGCKDYYLGDTQNAIEDKEIKIRKQSEVDADVRAKQELVARV